MKLLYMWLCSTHCARPKLSRRSQLFKNTSKASMTFLLANSKLFWLLLVKHSWMVQGMVSKPGQKHEGDKG